MGGTIVCDVTEPRAGSSAAEYAGALGARLDLRLVLVYVASGPLPGADEGVAAAVRRRAAQTFDEIGRGIARDAERRLVVGDHAEAVARVAAEEGADLVVVGGRPAGVWGRRNLRWALARQLAAATPVPVLLAPPSVRRRSDRRLAVADAETR
jgi:nucleotide-binding universal stress UspA family protein